MPKNTYKKSLLFDVSSWSDDRRINLLADQITNEIVFNFKRGYRRYKKKYDHTIKNVLLNLLCCFDHPTAEWVAYSRNKNNYGINTRYNRLHINYDPLMNVVDTMIDRGYIENKLGINFDRVKYTSRMRPTPKLLRLLQPCKKAKAYKVKELVQLKDEKKLLDYEDNRSTRRMRRNLKRLNRLIADARIEISLTNEMEVEFYKRRKRWLDCSRIVMHRVFNRDWKKGGRFYGPWWQGVNSKYRSFIEINGERAVELDYSCFHTRMLYDIEGVKQPVGDMYLYEGCSPSERVICKSLLNMIYNADTVDKAVRAAMSEYNRNPSTSGGLTKDKTLKILEPLMKKHAPIAKYAGSKVWSHLQFLDSQIAERIMLTLANMGVVCLPVHDSFVVPESCERLLWEAMRREYMNVLGKEPVIDKK